MQEYKALGVACAAAAAAGVALVAYTLAGKKKATATPSTASSTQTAAKASQFSSPLEQLESDLTNKTSREILLEQMDRTRLFYGEEAWANIEKAFVVVVGVGGVGSAAAHVLVRSGVGRLRLVDPDAVTLSSLNRNAVAMRADVGSPKVATLAKHFKLINPDTKVETMETFFEESIASSVLSGKPDLVLDCIDNRETKAQLISYCAANNIKVVSCFGAGCVMDFKSIRVVDLASTHGCPLAKKVRREIREYCAKHGLVSPVDGEANANNPILCVYSNEQRKKKLKPLTDEELANLRAQGVKRTVRVRTLGVTMVMPTVFGSLIADTALSLLAGVPVEYEKEVNIGAKQFSISKMLKTLKKREARLFKTPRVQIEKTLNTFVAIHLLETVFNKSSAISGKNKYLNFVRWRPNKPFAIDNVAVVTESEAEAHAAVTDVDAFYPPELVKEIDAKLAAVPAAYEKAIADGKVKVQERAEKKKKNEKPQPTPETTTTTITTAEDKVAEPGVTDSASN